MVRNSRKGKKNTLRQKSRKLSRFKLLLDQGLSNPNIYKNLNNYHHVRNVRDFGGAAWSDKKIYKFAKERGFHLVVFNKKDFKKLIKKKDSIGVFLVTQNLAEQQIDKKMVSYLKNATNNSLKGKKIYIKAVTNKEKKN